MLSKEEAQTEGEEPAESARFVDRTSLPRLYGAVRISVYLKTKARPKRNKMLCLRIGGGVLLLTTDYQSSECHA
jgi:hypothetical protein